MTLSILALMAALGSTPARAAPTWLERYEVGAAVDAGGPLVFRDPADARLAPTRVVEYGGRLGVRLGAPEDPHRFGLVVGWHALARSGGRALDAIDPLAVYATGDDLELQLGLGARFAIAGDRFRLADGGLPFTGPLVSAELRHAFLDERAVVPLGVTLGAFAEAALATPAAYSTAFAGMRVELVYRNARRNSR